ncbi:SDR family NAD(P)-dependent oxidoreductase [Paracoccus onubensis]|uniref:SDR family oxidoreductase n=1 Tax=Paracoccus onubensis TaxID=1675788 RepID=A0A418SU75_9RHOB|nr:SDR family NAD(P)-dependent oxidoreductase [Paracoccus onubensis]RJE84482.1 SDR family oxidoreductase [Paracoccus onubensis]
MKDREFTDRVVLLTGASRNIGRAIATNFGAGGASVMIHANSDHAAAETTAEAVRGAGGQAEVILGDLADPDVPARLIEATIQRFGRLDSVVANAAIRPHSPLQDTSYGEWRLVMSIALDSVFLLAKAAEAPLRGSDRAAFITIGGMTAQTGASDRVHVIAAKAGLGGLTRALAHEWGRAGITVNCVAPGLIDTRRTGGTPAHHATMQNVLDRHGTADEIAGVVLALAGSGMRYVTGQTLHANGGAWMG